jgi:RNA recognition motif-containing protein
LFEAAPKGYYTYRYLWVLMTPWLFVDGFPNTVTRDHLRELFARAGGVRRVLIVEGSRRRVAFVEMATDEEAKQAARTLSGFELLGQRIRVLVTGDAPPFAEGS